MKKDTERFQRVYTQGTMQGMQIWVDKETGVNYLFHFAGYRGGLTPLLDGEEYVLREANYNASFKKIGHCGCLGA